MATKADARQNLKASEQKTALRLLQKHPTMDREFVAEGAIKFKLRVSQLRREDRYDIRSTKLSDGSRRYSLWGMKGQRVQLTLDELLRLGTPAVEPVALAVDNIPRPSAKIKRNRARCRHCADTIESNHVDEIVCCECGAIGVGGGLDHLKRTGELVLIEELSEFESQ